MKKLLILLTLCAPGIMAQKAVYNNFSPIVKGITVGDYHCYLWFKDAVPSPYSFEIACYGYTVPVIIAGPKELPIPFNTFTIPGGYINWLLRFNNDGTINLQMSGMGPDDTQYLVINETI